MLKILYAADNRSTSFYTLKRFLDTYKRYYDIKVAAYSKSIGNLNANWNLDALLDFTGKSKGITFKNTNFPLYVREVKRFNPNLIISDVEVYSSYVALELGIPVWQVSPLLLYYGLPDKGSLYKYYSGVFSKDIDRNKYINYIMSNSDKRFILSHIGDLMDRPDIDPAYEWVRPNYQTISNEHNLIDITASGMHFADAYFSSKQTIPQVDYNDPESIVTSEYNYKYGLSVRETSSAYVHFPEITINSDVKFLSQHLRALDI
jgi:hypothetical protein